MRADPEAAKTSRFDNPSSSIPFRELGETFRTAVTDKA